MIQSKKLKSVFYSFLLLSASLFVSLILLEYLICNFFPQYDPSGRLSYGLTQDGMPFLPKNWNGRQWKNTGDYNVSITTNKYGFRDSKDLAMSTTQDIFVVGDSFSFGHGVEESKRYSNVLEKMLSIPVYNISLPTDFDGYDKLLSYAKENGAIIHNPILGVCMENDLRDYHYTEGQISEHNKDWNIGGLKAYLTEHSATYNAMTHITHQNSYLHKLAVMLGLVVENFEGMHRNLDSTVVLDSSVKRLVALINKHRIDNTIILIIPSRALWVGGNETVERTIHAEFIDLCHKYNLTVIDLKSVFEKDSHPLEYHFKNDGHWNEKGHLKAADAIYSYIKQHMVQQ